MGRKVHPIIFRIGHGNRTWKSLWFSGRNFAELLEEDARMRKLIQKEMSNAGIGKVEIRRQVDKISMTIFTSKPGVVIGRGGAGIEELKAKLEKRVLKGRRVLQINIQEVKKPNLSAEIVLQDAIAQIEKRMPFRRVLKSTIGQVMDAGAEGVKISVAGRLNGAEIARTEKLSQGRLPLHTMRANIDYSRGNAHTTYGVIGVKVWINRGEEEDEMVITENAEGKEKKKTA